MWGPTFLGWMLRQQYRAVCIAEHHLTKCAEAEFDARSLGYNSSFTSAQPFKDTKAAGGTSVHQLMRYEAETMISSKHKLPDGTDPLDWTAVKLPFHALDIIVVSLYCTATIGLVGINIRKISQLIGWLSMIGIPWLVFADWNFSPAILGASRLLDCIDCNIITPVNTHFTCTMGKGNLIDFGLGSSSIQWLIGPLYANVMPWGPHLGLTCEVQREAPNLSIRRLITPRPFDLAKLKTSIRQKILATTDLAITWDAAKEIAASYMHNHRMAAPDEIHSSLPYRFTLHHAEHHKPSVEYCEWVTTMEVYLASNTQNAGAFTHVVGNYIGRGYGPQFAIADLKSATPRKTWTNPVIQSLQIIVKSIHALEKLRTKPQAYAQTCRVLKQIDEQLNTLPAEKFEEDVAGFEDDELMHHVANIRHEHDSDLCDIRAGMENKLNRYKNLYYTEQRREVTEWALADPAGANIYAWLRKDTAAPQLMTQVQTPECRITTPLGLMEHRATIWEQLWHRNRASFPRIVEVLGELRRRAVQTNRGLGPHRAVSIG